MAWESGLLSPTINYLCDFGPALLVQTGLDNLPLNSSQLC